MRPWYPGLGLLLRALRRGRGWSLRRAVHEAVRLGVPVDRTLLRRIESGDTVPGRVVLRRLAVLYAAPADELEEEAYLAAALRPPPPLPAGAGLAEALERALDRGRPLEVLARTEQVRGETAGAGPPPGEGGCRAWLLRAAAARALGLPHLARRTLAEVAALPVGGAAILEARWRIAEESLARGAAGEALAQFAGQGPPPPAGHLRPRARYLAREGEILLASGDRRAGLERLDEARRLARRAGDPALVGEVVGHRARAVGPFDPRVGRALAREAVREVRHGGDRRALARRLLDLAMLLPPGDPGAAAEREEMLAEAARVAREARLPLEEFLALDATLVGDRSGGARSPSAEGRRRDHLLSRLPWYPPAALRRRREILAEARRRVERGEGEEERVRRIPAAREVPCAS